MWYFSSAPPQLLAPSHYPLPTPRAHANLTQPTATQAYPPRPTPTHTPTHGYPSISSPTLSDPRQPPRQPLDNLEYQFPKLGIFEVLTKFYCLIFYFIFVFSTKVSASDMNVDNQVTSRRQIEMTDKQTTRQEAFHRDTKHIFSSFFSFHATEHNSLRRILSLSTKNTATRRLHRRH